MKVRYSELLKELIEFEVELAEVPTNKTSKDVVVTWKMFDNWEANKTFWTDSNGLEMQERIVNFNPSYPWSFDKQNISANFYPVDSAIAMRDVRKAR